MEQIAFDMVNDMTSAGNAGVNVFEMTGSYTVYTDGGCKFNPGGPGGYGAVIINEDTGEIEELCGGFRSSTNNRMEIMAVIKALEALPGGTRACVHSDSMYVVKTILGEFSKKKNTDLWRRLEAAMKGKMVEVVWVQGHSGNEYNERCDKLAAEGYESGALEEDTGYFGTDTPSWAQSKNREMNEDVYIERENIPAIDDVDEFAKSHGINAKCAKAIAAFYKKEKHTFADYRKLKSGADKQSRKPMEQLVEEVGYEKLDAILASLPEEDSAKSAMKWHLRGLTTEDAIKKVLTDEAVARNAIESCMKKSGAWR